MINPYFLDEHELANSIIFLGFLDFSHLSKPINEIKDTWDNKIFNQLLRNQPELRFEYDYFWSLFESVESKKEFYANVFKNKIEIENYPALFNFSKLYIGQQSQRVNLFKFLNFKSEKFIFLMHNFLLNNTPKDDDSIYKSYFEIIFIKNKLLKNEEVLTVIDGYSTGKDLVKLNAKINSYSLFEKNKILYNRMLKNMNNLFVESAVVANFFQQKLDYYFPEFEKEKEIFKLTYMNRNPFLEEETYSYIFELNEHFIFDITKKSLLEIDEFKILLTTSLYKSILKIDSEIVFNGDMYNSNKLNLNFKNLFQKERIKIFCSSLISLFDFKNYPWESSFSEKIKYISSSVENQYFDNLLQNNSIKKEEKKAYFKI